MGQHLVTRYRRLSLCLWIFSMFLFLYSCLWSFYNRKDNKNKSPIRNMQTHAKQKESGRKPKRRKTIKENLNLIPFIDRGDCLARLSYLKAKVKLETI